MPESQRLPVHSFLGVRQAVEYEQLLVELARTFPNETLVQLRQRAVDVLSGRVDL